MRKKTRMQRLEEYLEPRYGRVLTREERRERNADVPTPTLREAFNQMCGSTCDHAGR